jgi:hypothetical protein
MKNRYRKYGYLVILFLIIAWILFSPYPFRKSGLDENMYYFIFAYVFFISFLIILLLKNLRIVEKIALSVLVSAFAFMFTTNPIMIAIEDIEWLFPGDLSKFFWRTRDRILGNFIFYSLVFLNVTVIGIGYDYLRGRIIRKRNQNVNLIKKQ